MYIQCMLYIYKCNLHKLSVYVCMQVRGVYTSGLSMRGWLGKKSIKKNLADNFIGVGIDFKAK